MIQPTLIINNKFNLVVNTSVPAIYLIHICDKSNNPPGPVTNLQIFNVTKDEVLLIWKDNQVGTR